jgi:cell division protein FtsB
MSRDFLRKMIILSLVLSMLSSIIALVAAIQSQKFEIDEDHIKIQDNKKLRSELDTLHKEIAMLKAKLST